MAAPKAGALSDDRNPKFVLLIIDAQPVHGELLFRPQLADETCLDNVLANGID